MQYLYERIRRSCLAGPENESISGQIRSMQARGNGKESAHVLPLSGFLVYIYVLKQPVNQRMTQFVDQQIKSPVETYF